EGARTLDEHLRLHDVAKEQAEECAQRAKDMLGHYQPGWPPLAESTQAERERQDYAADEPLLRTGQLRDDITVETDAAGLVADIGIPANAASAPYAAAQEYGTIDIGGSIPPRPFLRPALDEQAPHVVAAVDH